MRAILVVDDHKLLARVSCEVLQRQGYHAECAFDPYEALAKFDGGKFDMLVTDYRMDGMSGLELAKLIRKKAPGLPVIIVTGCLPTDQSDEVHAWIEKQDLYPALLDKIDFLLRDPRESPSA